MTFIDPVRHILRSSPTWVSLRRWQREGFLQAYQRSCLWRRVLETQPVRTLPRSSGAVEVHTICFRLDYLSAIWSLKSFYQTARVEFPLVIHVNGNAERVVLDRLRWHFPDATLIPRDVADGIVEPQLIASGFTRLFAARRAVPYMVKLVDVPLLAEGAVVVYFDSDVLFFEEPKEIIDHCTQQTQRYLFQRDPENNYNISQVEAMQEFGIQLESRLNSGVLVYPRKLHDMAAFERYLGHPGVAQPTPFIEQTLYALHASEIASVDLLSPKYLIDLQAGLSYDGLTARHYAGPSRPLLTSEGIPRIIRSGLLIRGQL
jgi:hypothetical protein